MKAMILAAGEGNRLKPVTDKVPKALVDINGTPILEIVIRRLIKAGAESIIINVCHLARMVEEFLKANGNFGVHIELSNESSLLDTGGGLKKASYFFDDGRPFFLHNVDILSDIDLTGMYRLHTESGALATLAVKERKSRRYLLFDGKGLLCGKQSGAGLEWAGSPVTDARRLGFCGIHVISPEIFRKMTESGVFSINGVYLRLAGEGEEIRAFNADPYDWHDIGGPEKLEEARRYAKEKGPLF